MSPTDPHGGLKVLQCFQWVLDLTRKGIEKNGAHFRVIPFEILMGGAEWKISRTPLTYFYLFADPPPPRTYFIF